MPQLDTAFFPMQLFWLAVTFVVLYLLMSRFALPRVGAAIEARAEKIDGDLAAAQAARLHSQSLLQELETALTEARAKARTMLTETGAELAKEAAVREAEVHADLALEAERAQVRIGEAKHAALSGLTTVAAEVAEAASGRLLGTMLPRSDVDAAITAVLQERR